MATTITTCTSDWISIVAAEVLTAFQQLTVTTIIHVPCSRKIWRFGGLACDRQIKIRQYFILVCIRMAIPYRTAKFKSANIFTIAI